MTSSAQSLVCFAVKEEAGHFRKLARRRSGVRILLTGMGRGNAEKAIMNSFAHDLPQRVVTAGFAGGLLPDLAKGTVVFSEDPHSGLGPALVAAGARPVRFYCADNVLATAEEKRALHETSGAGAVEMESERIQFLCRARNLPVATVRVILDTAGEDLALDFDQFLTADKRIDGAKLAWTLLKAPSKIRALLRLRKESAAAARRLAEVLARVLFL